MYYFFMKGSNEMEINDIIQKYVDLDYNRLLEIATGNMQKILPYFEKTVKDDAQCNEAIMLFLGTVLATDGKFTDLEYKFLNELLGGDMDYKRAKKFVASNYSDDNEDYADSIFDACPDEIKSELLSLCLCLAAVDETVTREETRLIKKFMEN